MPSYVPLVRRPAANVTAAAKKPPSTVGQSSYRGSVAERGAYGRMSLAHRESEAKLRVGAVSDRLEREVDSISEQVSATPRSATVQASTSGDHVQALRLGRVEDPQERAAEAVAAEVEGSSESRLSGTEATSVRGPTALRPDQDEAIGRLREHSGRTLPPSLRSSMESMLAADLSRVRLHVGPGPASLAQSLQARAFTVGSDVFFGRAAWRPGLPAGRALLAHELAHVVQARRSPASATTIRRAPGEWRDPGPGFAPRAGFASKHTPKERPSGEDYFQSIWTPAVEAESETDKAFALSRFMDRVHDDDLGLHGGTVVRWMVSNGFTDEAVQLMLPHIRRGLRSQFELRYPLETEEHLGMTSTLIALGEKAATEQKHTLARDFLITAALALAMRILVTVGGRTGEWSMRSTRAVFHAAAAQLAAMLRRIHSVYPRLARQHIRYRPELAEEYRHQGQELVVALTSIEAFDVSRTEVFTPGLGREESLPGSELHSRGRSGGKQQFDMYGFGSAPDQRERVTPLVEDINADVTHELTSLVDVTTTIDAQEWLVTDLVGIPEVQRALAGRVPDMTNRGDRLIVWKAIYKSPSPDPLAALLGYVRRVLQAFTKHGGWNVSEVGKSYLKRELPKDLAGRVLQDCGVFAVTVASEVAHALAATSQLNTVDFELVFYPGHAALVIVDRVHKHFYAINNTEITGPEPVKGLGIEQRMGQLYGATVGRQHVVTPTAFIPIPGAVTGEQFDARLWNRYSQVGAAWGLDKRVTIQDGDVRMPNDQATFDHVMASYDRAASMVLRAVEEHRRQDPTLQDIVRLADTVNSLKGLVIDMLRVFTDYGSRSNNSTAGFRQTASGRQAAAMARKEYFVHSSATKPSETKSTPFEGYAALLAAYIIAVEQGTLVPANGQMSLSDARSLETLLEANVLQFFRGPVGP